MIRQLLFYLREYLFPYGCGACGEALFTPVDDYYGLCGECRSMFQAAFTTDKRCEICGKPLITEKDTCLSCRSSNEQQLKLLTLFPYSGKFKAALGAFKFRKSIGVGNFFAEFLIMAIDELVTTEKIALVPVPPRPGKIKKQGWDQIAFLAKLLERQEKWPVQRCLKRLVSQSQKGLNRKQRGSNLKGRILCVKKPPEIAILFDDVITTGATLNACAAALLEGGAKKVYGVCLFYD